VPALTQARIDEVFGFRKVLEIGALRIAIDAVRVRVADQVVDGRADVGQTVVTGRMLEGGAVSTLATACPAAAMNTHSRRAIARGRRRIPRWRRQ
jgi:hypothetical protein